MTEDKPVTGPLLVVAGPTASGKSALACDLARALDGVVINADSMQLYADLAVLTDRPPQTAMEAAPHRLYGILDAAESCSVGRWRAMARREVDAALAGGKLPILTGGTGLYLRKFFGGLAEIPPVPAAVRADADDLRRRLGAEAFHRRLAERDPQTAARLHVNDSQRVMRAWEVIEATGVSLAEWQRQAGEPGDYRAVAIILDPPRTVLHAAAAARFHHMLDHGGLAEVECLLERGLPPALPAMKALGVRQLARHIEGECSLEEAAEEAVTATRRYIKRQKTWFRNQSFGSNIMIKRLNEKYSESHCEEICSFITKNLLTPAADVG